MTLMLQKVTLCCLKVNCNLEGVMVNEVLDYSPAVEMLRVPLIVSIY